MSCDAYHPDNWVILKIETQPETNETQDETIYKVLGGWSGGYLDGDSWRMNSGIVSHERDGDYWLFHGHSGSVYRCHADTNLIRKNIAGVLANLESRFNNQVEVLQGAPWENEGWKWI
jgi:hypothetical protein